MKKTLSPKNAFFFRAVIVIAAIIGAVYIILHALSTGHGLLNSILWILIGLTIFIAFFAVSNGYEISPEASNLIEGLGIIGIVVFGVLTLIFPNSRLLSNVMPLAAIVFFFLFLIFACVVQEESNGRPFQALLTTAAIAYVWNLIRINNSEYFLIAGSVMTFLILGISNSLRDDRSLKNKPSSHHE